MFGVPQNTILRELGHYFLCLATSGHSHLQSLFSFELTQTSPSVNSLFPWGGRRKGSGLQKTISGNHLILQVPEVMMITVGADKELNKIFKKLRNS